VLGVALVAASVASVVRSFRHALMTRLLTADGVPSRIIVASKKKKISFCTDDESEKVGRLAHAGTSSLDLHATIFCAISPATPTLVANLADYSMEGFRQCFICNRSPQNAINLEVEDISGVRISCNVDTNDVTWRRENKALNRTPRSRFFLLSVFLQTFFAALEENNDLARLAIGIGKMVGSLHSDDVPEKTSSDSCT
jgi:hypothetical protein